MKTKIMNTPNLEILAEEIRNQSNVRVTVEQTCVVLHLPHGQWELGNANENWQADFRPFVAHEVEAEILATLDLGFTSQGNTSNRAMLDIADCICRTLGIAQ